MFKNVKLHKQDKSKTKYCDISSPTKNQFDINVFALSFDIINKKTSKMLERTRGNSQPSAAYTYQYYPSNLQIIINLIFNTLDLSSYKSHLQFDIIRTPIKTDTKPRSISRMDNPYVHKPKSYSTKRQQGGDQNLQKSAQILPVKRIKKETLTKNGLKRHCHLDLEKISKQTNVEANSYFEQEFFMSIDQEFQQKKFPLNEQVSNARKKNPMLKSSISIISNKNQKFEVLIHEGLLLSHTSHEKKVIGEDFQDKIVNPYCVQRRDYYLYGLKFQTQYRNGYAPIELQYQNNDSDQQDNVGTKTHYIRKKQTTLSLPRTCGVSYIKPSQSTQSHPYTPLPSLIFQCSSAFNMKKQESEQYAQITNRFLTVCHQCIIPFIKCHEDEMRNLLLGEKIGEVGWVKGIENMWPNFVDGMFFLLIFGVNEATNEEQVWNEFSTSIFKVGLLIKKSTSGKKAFLKSIGIDNYENIKKKSASTVEKQKQSPIKGETEIKDDESLDMIQESKKQESPMERKCLDQLLDTDSTNVSTLSIRLETYVQQSQWKSLSSKNKGMMFHLAVSLKQNLEKRCLKIISKRVSVSQLDNKEKELSEILKFIRKPISHDSKMEEQKKKLIINPAKFIAKEQLDLLFRQKIANMEKYQQKVNKNSEDVNYSGIIGNNFRNQNIWEKNLKMPLYYISTRDSFAYDLIEKIEIINLNGRKYKKIQYFFDPENLPGNYNQQYRSRFPNFDVGITCYHDFFTDEELKVFENNTFLTQKNAFKNKFLQMTVQPSIVTGRIKRTKFFFGYRYIWTKTQIAQPGSKIGAGVRQDVTPPPKWTNRIVNAFTKNNIAEKQFINSIAINVYHDGKEGLAQHFDDAVRFKQPIYTLRLFSDARLSFGSQFYGFCNGAFIIPLPRGCICVMEENSYAANGVKHCVRPCDMTGKSAAVILRQMHHKVVKQAARLDEYVDFPAWLSTISDKKDCLTFAQQKRRESEYNIQLEKKKKKKKNLNNGEMQIEQ